MSEQLSNSPECEPEGPSMATEASQALVSVRYGNEVAIDEDVDVFERFYVSRYGRQAAEKVHASSARNRRFMGISMIVVAAACAIPKVVLQLDSWFAITLLIIAAMLLVGGIVVLRRAATGFDGSDEAVAAALSEEFDAARTKRNRIFDLVIDDEGIQTIHGVRTGLKQRHAKKFDEIECIDITDELIFVKGITWFSRFQLGDDLYLKVVGILLDHCADVVNDERPKVLASSEG